jgi:SH3-like domain-containing protein
MRKSQPALALLIGAWAALSSAQAASQQVGSATGLPLPRFASLKTDRVNLREGPSKEHATRVVFQRAGLPVEIVAEFETWRRIRDSEGTEGWVLHSLLSGRRTALVAPWRKGEVLALRQEPKGAAALAARLETGVIGSVKSCDGQWCRLTGEGYDGYIEQSNVWGVYPGDTVK